MPLRYGRQGDAKPSTCVVTHTNSIAFKETQLCSLRRLESRALLWVCDETVFGFCTTASPRVTAYSMRVHPLVVFRVEKEGRSRRFGVGFLISYPYI